MVIFIDLNRFVMQSTNLISKLSIAPMIDWTYTHFRVLMRMLAPEALLYTEMQTTGAVLHQPQRSLHFDSIEKPIALQLGGADRHALVMAAKLAERIGFAEINLNLGCPSDRVQAGRFGACLMKEPLRVADCIKAMKDAVQIPVTAKTRIGIDDQDSYDFFSEFVHQLIVAGCDKLIVHARKAWLHGLNPKQNRTIPPLHYEYVYQIKQTLLDIPVVINGNINELSEVTEHLEKVDGVMLGRLACQNPYAIAVIHQVLFPNQALRTRTDILRDYIAYIQSQQEIKASLNLLLKPLFTFAHGLSGAKRWKLQLMTIAQSKDTEAIHNLVNLMEHME